MISAPSRRSYSGQSQTSWFPAMMASEPPAASEIRPGPQAVAVEQSLVVGVARAHPEVAKVAADHQLIVGRQAAQPVAKAAVAIGTIEPKVNVAGEVMRHSQPISSAVPSRPDNKAKKSLPEFPAAKVRRPRIAPLVASRGGQAPLDLVARRAAGRSRDWEKPGSAARRAPAPDRPAARTASGRPAPPARAGCIVRSGAARPRGAPTARPDRDEHRLDQARLPGDSRDARRRSSFARSGSLDVRRRRCMATSWLNSTPSTSTSARLSTMASDQDPVSAR